MKAPKPEVVERSVPRHDGGWMIVTRKGNAAVSLQPIPEGVRIAIRDGRAERISQ